LFLTGVEQAIFDNSRKFSILEELLHELETFYRQRQHGLRVADANLIALHVVIELASGFLHVDNSLDEIELASPLRSFASLFGHYGTALYSCSHDA